MNHSLRTIRHMIQPELVKIRRMLLLFFRHEGTHVAACFVLLLGIFRWWAREANRQRAIASWINSTWSTLSHPPSRSPPKRKRLGLNLNQVSSSTRLRSVKRRSIRRASKSVGYLLSTYTPSKSTLPTRSVSNRNLQTLMKRSDSQKSLCSGCMSRATSHNSLAELASELDEFAGTRCTSGRCRSCAKACKGSVAVGDRDRFCDSCFLIGTENLAVSISLGLSSHIGTSFFKKSSSAASCLSASERCYLRLTHTATPSMEVL